MTYFLANKTEVTRVGIGAAPLFVMGSQKVELGRAALPDDDWVHLCDADGRWVYDCRLRDIVDFEKFCVDQPIPA